MSGMYILKDGVPVVEGDLTKWSKFMNNVDNMRVALEEMGDVAVSTVFLGLDHSFGGPTPILWETMVFGGKLDGKGERYSSVEKAKAGHDKWVQDVKAAKADSA